MGTLFTYFGLACNEVWVQCAMHKVRSAMCAVQTLPLMLDAKFFQHLLRCRQQASHQTPTLYPPVQMTMPRLAELNIYHTSPHLSHTFCLF